MSTKSLSFGSAHARLAHLLASGGGIAGEVADVRQDVEAAFEASDFRTGFPSVDWVHGTPAATGASSVVLHGSALLQSQTFDHATITDSGAGAAGSIVITALKPGVSGITVVVATPSGTLALAYSPSTKVLTITPTASTGDTDNTIATAINADNSVVRGILRATSGGLGSIKNAIASTALAGGLGDYAHNTVTISGVEALPANTTGATGVAAWSDTIITVTAPDLTAASPARATSDIVKVSARSNDVVSLGVSLVLGGGGIAGPTGPTGAAGATGAHGATGPTGPTS